MSKDSQEATKDLFQRIQSKLSFTEQMKFIWWSAFKKYKLRALDDGLRSGLSKRAAFELALEADENYTHTGGRAKATAAYRRSIGKL